MSKTSEKLIILLDVNNGLLARMYNLIEFKKPNLLDAQTQKVCDKLLKKFPEYPEALEKTAGFEAFHKKAPEIVPQLKEFYQTFNDVLEFKEAAWQLLEDMAKNVIDFRFDTNQDITVRYLDLLVGYIQLHLLMALVVNRKLLLSVYARAYHCTQDNSEPNYSRVAVYVHEFDNPIVKLQEQCVNLGLRVGDSLMSLQLPFYKWTTIKNIRETNIFNLVDNIDSADKPVQLESHSELMHLDKFRNWILYGFLICPAQLERDGSRELLKQALGDSWVVPIFRDKLLNIHEEYYTLFHAFKLNKFKLTNHKDIIKEAAVNAVANSGLFHAQLRNLLRWEMKNQINFFRESPGLFGPKMQMVYAVISLARSEVMWLFYHLGRHPPKSKGKYVEEHFRDDNISQLIYLIDDLTTLASQHQALVRDYYIRYIGGPDAKALKPHVDACLKDKLNTGVKALLAEVMNTVLSISEQTVAKADGLEAFRLNWYRVSAALSTSAQGVNPKLVKDLSAAMNVVIAHSRHVDRLQSQLKQYGSLKLLWWFGPILDKVFEQSLTGTRGQPQHCIAFLRVLNASLENVHRFCPEEQKSIGMAVLRVAQQYLRSIASTVDSLVRNIIQKEMHLQKQFEPAEAAYRVQRLQQQQASDPSAAPRQQPLPGYESMYVCRSVIENLREWRKVLSELCTALRETESVTVFDYEFVPREFLYDRLVSSIRASVRRLAVIEKGIERPTLFLSNLKKLITGFSSIDKHMNMDVSGIVRQVLLSEFYDASTNACGEPLKLDNPDEKKDKAENVLINALSSWYKGLLEKKLGSMGISWSEFSKGFISRPVLNAKGQPEIHLYADQYADLSELVALCTVAGPYGVRVIEKDLLSAVSSHIAFVKDVLAANREVLTSLVGRFTDPIVWTELVAKIRDLDKLLKYSIMIGCTLQFRRLLREALEIVVKQQIPAIHDTIKSAHQQYAPNLNAADPFLTPVDHLALDCGIDLGLSDHWLKAALLRHKQTSADDQLWRFLPELFGACFINPEWKGAIYDVSTEGHLNNAHCLAECVSSLIVGFNSLPLPGTDGTKIAAAAVDGLVHTALERYVRCAAHSILHMAGGSVPAEQFQDYHKPSLMIFLEKFIQACSKKYASMAILEDFFPFSILRTNYISLYEKQALHDAHQAALQANEEKVN